MSRWQLTFAAINIVGGIAILGSYVHGALAIPNAGDFLWGQVPAGWRLLYTGSMFLAAAGYVALATFLLFRVDPDQVRLTGGLGYPWLLLPFLLILVGSAVWMPMMEWFAQSGGEGLWLAIRVVLALVGAGSLTLLVLLAGLQPREPSWHWGLSVAGAVAFLFQTGVLDAILWTSRYRG